MGGYGGGMGNSGMGPMGSGLGTHTHTSTELTLYFISSADCSLVCALLISLCMLYPSHRVTSVVWCDYKMNHGF